MANKLTYQQWKEENQEFLEQYIKEFLTNNVSVYSYIADENLIASNIFIDDTCVKTTYKEIPYYEYYSDDE